MTRLIRIFQDADLRCSDLGLTELAEKAKIKTDELQPGEILIFVNVKATMVKVLANSGYGLVYAGYRSQHGRLERRALKHIPAAFGGGVINYDKALAATLEELLPDKKRRSDKP
jgi:hypothetical protein